MIIFQDPTLLVWGFFMGRCSLKNPSMGIACTQDVLHLFGADRFPVLRELKKWDGFDVAS
ncbi:hypothetical protein ACL6C3_15380 [Capilliphycus salinus ALCB114379]|uniref:hypothetical protein n=1 Tax=Capilliphycus salinus TaxID=2768948 RepID=UPI0039A5E29D